jgi:kumamolisin
MDSSRLRGGLLPRALACAAVTAGGLGVTAGVASAAGSDPMTAVPQGITAQQLPGAEVFGNTPPNTPESVSFVLRARGGIQSLADAVQRGTQGQMSARDFAARYGQSASVVSAIERYLNGYGISTTHTSDNLEVTANGTAGEFDQALTISQSEYRVPARPGRGGARGEPAQTVHGTNDKPQLPRSLAQSVLGVFGITNYAPFVSQAIRVPASTHPRTSSGSCISCNLPTDFANRYGLSPLYNGGAYGQGQTIGIMTYATLDPGAPQYFWNNVEKLPASLTGSRTVTPVNVDGGAGAPSDAAGTGETDLDVEQSGGVAPEANVVVYQAPNSDAGTFAMYYTAASQDVADTVSESWGESETYALAAIASAQEDATYQLATDQAFLEMAAQGQSPFVSSGDYGAYTAAEDLGTTNLSVSNPADTPYATAAGGTTLPWSGTVSNAAGTQTAAVNVPSERAWGWDYLWGPIASVNGVSESSVAEGDTIGDGGGYSALEDQPAYQRGVSGTTSFNAVPYLTPTDPQNVGGITEPTAWDFNPNPSIVQGSGSGRAMPDVSTDADPYTGYLLYEPSAVAPNPPLEGGWGGTSFVAPELNGSASVIDSAVGHRVGLWNPVIYRAAGSGNSPFDPLNATSGTTNDNLYYTSTPGTVFNPAVGLGVPDLSKVAAAFTGRGPRRR